MTFLVDPIVFTPTDWLQDQAHVERRSAAPTPGATGPQACQDWLTPLSAAVRLVTTFLRGIFIAGAAPLLSAVAWLQARLTLYDQVYRPAPAFTTLSSLPVLEAGILLCENKKVLIK